MGQLFPSTIYDGGNGSYTSSASWTFQLNGAVEAQDAEEYALRHGERVEAEERAVARWRRAVA